MIVVSIGGCPAQAALDHGTGDLIHEMSAIVQVGVFAGDEISVENDQVRRIKI